MGNINSASSSPLSLVQSLAKAKYSLLGEKPENLPGALQKLGDIVTSIDGIHAKQFGSKEVKLGVQICADLLDISSRGNPAFSARCLELLRHLVSIQSISRRALDELFPGSLGTFGGRTALTPHQQFEDVDASVLLLAAIMRALKCAEDESIETTFLQRAEKAGFFSRLLIVVTQASTSRQNDLLCAAVLALEIIFYVLNKPTNDKIAPAQRRMVLDVMQHKDSIFELSRHPIRHLAYCSASVLLKLMTLESKDVCIAVQDAARAYGALLWSLHRVVQDVGVVVERSRGTTAPIHPENGTYNLALAQLFLFSPVTGSAVDYIDRGDSVLTESIFEDVEEVAYDDTIVPNQVLLAYLCLGNAQNSNIVLSCFPDAMDELCSGSLSIAQVLNSHAKTDVAKDSYMEPSLPSTELSFSLDFVQRCQEHVSRDTDTGSADVLPPETGGSLIRWRRASTTRRALQSRQQMLSDFASKMGDGTNWITLFRSIALTLSHHRIEWNKDSLQCLESAIAEQVELLDFRRRFRHEAWDPTLLSVYYPNVHSIPSVNGYFLQRTLEALWMSPAESRREVVRDPSALALALVDRLVVSDSVSDGLICMRILYLLVSSVSTVNEHVRLTVLSDLIKRGTAPRFGNSAVDCINVGENKLQALWLYRCGELVYYALHHSSPDETSFFIRCGSFEFILDILSSSAMLSSMVYWRPITTERERSTLDRPLPSLALDSEVDGIDVISTLLRIVAVAMIKSAWYTSKVITRGDTFQKLTKILWLLSPHGALAPVGSNLCIDMVLCIVGRVLHTSPTAYMKLLADSEFFGVLISSTLLSDGSSNMSLATASFLQEFVLAAITVDADRCQSIEMTTFPHYHSSAITTYSDLATPEIASDSTSRTEELDTKKMARCAVGGNKSRRISFRAVKLSSSRQGKSSLFMKLNASAFQFLEGLIPTQLIRLICLLSPSAFIHIFNSPCVVTAEVIWNEEVRMQYLNRIRSRLSTASFARELQTCQTWNHSIAESKTDAESSVQVYGVYLANFLNASPDDFTAPFDVTAFIGEITKLLDVALVEFRLQELPEDLSKKELQEDAAPLDSPSIESFMQYLSDYSPAKRLSLFLSCLSRAFEMWRLEDDLWFDVVFPRVSNCLVAAVHALDALGGSAVTTDIDEQLEAILFSLTSLWLSCKFAFENDSPTSSYSMDRITTISISNMTSRPLVHSLSLSTKLFRHQWSANATHQFMPIFHSVSSIMAVGTSFVATLARKLELLAVDAGSKKVLVQMSSSGYNQGGEGVDTIVAGTGAISSMVGKMLFEYMQLPSLLVCCRHQVCLQSPQTAVNAMGTLRRYLIASAAVMCPPGPPSSEPVDISGSVFVKLVSVMTSSCLHLFLIESIASILELFCDDDKKSTNFVSSPDETYHGRQLFTSSLMSSIDSIVADSKSSLVSLIGLASSPRESMATAVLEHVEEKVGYRAVVVEAVELLKVLILATITESSVVSSGPAAGSTVSSSSGEAAEGARIGSSLAALLTALCTKHLGVKLSAIVGNHTFSLLDQLLTPSLLFLVFTDAPAFLNIFGANQPTHRPLAIWNEGMLSKLRSFIASETSKIDNFELSHPEFMKSTVDAEFYSSISSFNSEALFMKDGFRSMYTGLSDTVVVDGVHIQLLTDPKYKDDIGSRSLPKFVEELQSSLNSTKRVMDYLAKAPSEKQRRASMAGGSGARSLSSQVAVKQQVLEYLVRQHPELGFANLYVADDSTTD